MNNDKQEWLKARSKNVNSTEVSALYGECPYMTELELWWSKKTGEIREIEDNQRMRAGRFLEPSIAKLVGYELGCEVAPMDDYIFDEDRMGSSFDWQITSGDLEGWIVEIKNVDYLVYRDKWEEDEAPIHIEFQVQHQMEVSKRPGTIIAALVGGNDLKIIRRLRNEKVGASLRKRVKKFWSDIENDVEPTPDYSKDADFIIAMHQHAGAGVKNAIDDDILTQMFENYELACRDAKEADDYKTKLKAELMDMVGDYDKVLAGDGFTLHCGMTKSTPPEDIIITEDMIGQTMRISNGRKGYRQFRLTRKKK